MLAALALFLTYPALQKGGAWLSETLTMERGRFTPCPWRIDYRLRRCVPSCLALRCSDPRGCDPRGVDGAKGTRRRLLYGGLSQGRRTASPAEGCSLEQSPE